MARAIGQTVPMIDTLTTFAQPWLHGIKLELARYLIAATAVTLLYWLARRWTASRRIQNRTATMADRRREILLSMQAITIFGFVNVITFALIRAQVIHLSLTPSFAGIALQLGAMVLLHDAYFYWMHRGLHLPVMFRRAHAAHHRSRTPTSWASYAFAPIESVFEAIFVPIFLLVWTLFTPAYPLAIFIFLGHQIARNAIGHSGYELAWPGFTRSALTGWLTTTTHHDLHHSQGRYNYGLYFTWWDRWMGTEHPGYHEAFEVVAGRKMGDGRANLSNSPTR